MKVLVIGATGKQGGHVARMLLERGHTVYALTRNPDSPAAEKLSLIGAKVIKGDWSDQRSLERALGDVDALFAITTPLEGGSEVETKQGIAIAEAAKAQGKYLVFSSVGSSNKKTLVPFFESKWKVEQHIAKIGIEATVIAPVWFMENLITMSLPQLKEGLFPYPLPSDRKLAQVALDDIAGMAVLALENKQRFIGARIDLASDDLTGEQAAAILSDATGRHIKCVQIPIDEVRKRSSEVAQMFEWFERVGYNVDIAKLRLDYPEVKWHTYASWAKEQDWNLLLGLSPTGRTSKSGAY